MSESTDRFAPRTDAQVLTLVLENPLAWIVSRDGEGFAATPLPLRPVADAQGRIERLQGHFARSNRHVEVLRQDPRALILFSGPQAYISPSWVHNRRWAPTWNYAVVQFLTELRFDEDPAKLDTHLEDLVSAMERGRPGAWRISEMGERYASLKRHIIPFEARVLAQRARFKLGQDERDAEFHDITAGLKANGHEALVRWMNELNPERARP